MGRWMILAAAALGLLSAGTAEAQSLVASRTIRAQTVVNAQDIALSPETVPGALTDPAEAVGLETRVVLYAGRPIRPGDLGPPALIERNQTVTLHYRVGGLVIAAEGRALGRAGVGEVLRVMNNDSRMTVTGRVTEEGNIDVANRP
jgi:flagella basal body P-ring formation protein FlgA